MNTLADKTPDNKSRSIANSFPGQQSNVSSAFRFLDNRSEAVAQRKVQQMANSSPRVMQLRAFQEMANSDVIQRKITVGILKYDRAQAETRLKSIQGFAWNDNHRETLAALDTANKKFVTIEELTAFLGQPLLTTMNTLKPHTTHDGETPELTPERTVLYKAIRDRDLGATQTALQSTGVSCREGALILSAVASNKAAAINTLLTSLLYDSLGGDLLELFLLDNMKGNPYAGEPAVGVIINILGTVHTVVSIGKGMVVSLNLGQSFVVTSLAAEIRGLLESNAATVHTMLKLWLGHPTAVQQLTAIGRYDAFQDYVYDGTPSQATNLYYIQRLDLMNPVNCCTVSDTIANALR